MINFVREHKRIFLIFILITSVIGIGLQYMTIPAPSIRPVPISTGALVFAFTMLGPHLILLTLVVKSIMLSTLPLISH